MTKQFELLGKEDTRSLALDETRFHNKKELAAARAFARKLYPRLRTTQKPIVIGMIGMPGSGKSMVAQELARQIGGTILEYDQICFELRSRHVGYESSYNILGMVAVLVVHLGGNAVIDADLVEAGDRRVIRSACRGFGAKVLFVRTFADLSEIMSRSFRNSLDPEDYAKVVPLRKEAESGFMSTEVKVMKVFNFIPKHYRIGSGEFHRYDRRRLSCKLFADIDTTKLNDCRREVEECVRRCLK